MVDGEKPKDNEVLVILKATIDTLQGQLEIKDKHISELNIGLAQTSSALVSAQKMGQAEQTLHAVTMKKQLEVAEADPAGEPLQEKKKWWQRRK